MSVSISEVVSGSVLSSSTSLVEAITLRATGSITSEAMLAWLLVTPVPSTEFELLLKHLDGASFIQVVQAQQALAVAAASKNHGGVISCKVSKKGAVSLYGLGQMPITLYGQQWERFLASQGATDVDKSSILKLCKDPSAKGDYCFADYVFAKAKDSYGAPLKGEDLKYAAKLANGGFEYSHSFIIDGKPAKTSATAVEMVAMLSGNPSDGQLDDIRRKCAGIKVVVRLSTK